MNKEENKKAVEYFHAGPNNWNCAQSIVKSFQAESNMSDEDIELTYRSKGGGRAEGGLCGAVYAAKQMLGEDSPEAQALQEEFRQQWGALTCKELKAEKRVPCTDTVGLADQLLEKYLAIQQERLAHT
ncbi:C-GCAxxG-C-C family (seleno)protein [Porphyromonas gingivicanis]|uniref:C-GCAxxG-C-C family (seleno)protein n=1 Tax=Porphyromonas gingivicanis TaxID=266762 RepID=UPI000470CE02|nr:C-GCAxxG-C-C family (seleno)protein [Porphyromonas gingivicanis]